MHGLPDVQSAAVRVLQHVHARRRRRLTADALARLPPNLAPILEHECLCDEPPRELRRRAANAQDLRGQNLMIRRVAHLGKAGQEFVSEHFLLGQEPGAGRQVLGAGTGTWHPAPGTPSP